jgi:hypothetical protein
MPFYEEFPTDPVVNVNWKKPPDGGDGGPPYPPEPCGMFRFPNPAPYVGVSRWVIGLGYQPYMLGLANTRGSVDGSGHIKDTNSFIPVSIYDPATYPNDPYDLYYWGTSGQRLYDVTMTSLYDISGEIPLIPYLGMDINYGVAASDITMDTGFNGSVAGGYGEAVTLHIDTFFATSNIIVSCWGGIYPDPWVTDSTNAAGFGRKNLFNCADHRVNLTIQCYCLHQTTGAPPPQPPGHGWLPTVEYPPSGPIDPPQIIVKPVPIDESRRRASRAIMPRPSRQVLLTDPGLLTRWV